MATLFFRTLWKFIGTLLSFAELFWEPIWKRYYYIKNPRSCEPG